MQINIKNTAGPVGAVTKCGNVRVRKTVFTVVLIIGVLVIFAAFISFIALSATAGRGFGSRMQYIFIPFAVFGACAVTMPFLFTMRARYSQLVALADRIAAKDATVIASLAALQTVPAFEAMKITVGSLLKGGALPGYEIVGEVVAKTSLSLSEEKAKEMYDEFIALALPSAAALSMAKEQASPLPRYCPACGAPVRKDGVFYYCTNTVNCAPQIVAALDHFADKQCMDIEGFSEKTAEQLYNELHVSSPVDLYSLKEEDLLELDGFKEKKARNLLDSVERSKHATLARFIFALGIPTIGKKAAKQLESRFKTLDALKAATTEEIAALDDFGEITANNVTGFFKDPDKLKLIDGLLAAGIEFEEEEEAGEGVFSGRTVVFTGALTRYKRSEAQKIVRSLGGQVADTVSKNVNLVVAGSDAGSKLDKARKLGIEIIDEKKFAEIVDNSD